MKNVTYDINLWHPLWWPMIACSVWRELRSIEIVVSFK